MATAKEFAQWIVANKDKRDTPEFEKVVSAYRLQKAKEAPLPAREPVRGTARERFALGVAGTAGGTAQLATLGMSEGVNRFVDQTQAARQEANTPGFEFGDVAEFGGESAPYAVVAPLRVPRSVQQALSASTPIRQAAKTGAAVGTVAGATQPVAGVESPSDFFAGKALQIPVSAAGGAAFGPLLTQAGNLLGRVRNRLSKPEFSKQQITVELNQTLTQNGIDPRQVGGDLRRQLEAQLLNAKQTGGKLDEKALTNLGVLESVGARQHATRGMVTQEPVQYGEELSLKEISPELAARFQGVRNELGRRLGDLQRATPETTTPGTGRAALAVLKSADDAAKLETRQLYDAAEKASGNTVFIKSKGWMDAQKELREKRAWDDLDPAAKRILNDMSRGKLTVRQAIEDIESLNARWSPGDRGNVGLGIVKKHLDKAIDDAATDAGGAYRLARQRHRERMLAREQLPALDAAAKGGVAADDFMARHVYNAPVADVRNLMVFLRKSNPESANLIKARIIADLREAATKGEEGKFLQATYNAKLRELQDSELFGVMFTQAEQQTLRNVGRAGQLLEGPQGVSRTGMGGMARAINMLGNLLTKFGGKWLGGPLGAVAQRGSAVVRTQAALRQPEVARAGNELAIGETTRAALAAAGGVLPPLLSN